MRSHDFRAGPLSLTCLALLSTAALTWASGAGEEATVPADTAPGPQEAGLRFEISFPAERATEPQTGHIVLVVSRRAEGEPRFHYRVYSPDVQPGFGLDVEGLEPGETAVIDGSAFGWPVESVDRLPPGEYRVQAVLNRYETFRRSDGHVVELPPDRGEGQHWNRKPGNFYNAPRRVHLDPARGDTVRLSLDREIPPVPAFEDTEFVKYVRIRSELLSEFWGRPMYLGAIVLVPDGFDEHPEARYPLAIHHGHFPTGFGEFRETPPGPDLEGYERTRAEYGWDLYQRWTGPDFPRMLVMKIQHANPYYDDSYAVNSENLGPYGDAIVEELIPYVEDRFRGIGEGWARTLFGGSTGGWETLGSQIFYPDEFNGAWSFCPDPVDFRQYETVDIYQDTSAYYFTAEWKRTPQPSGRDYLGHLFTTVRADNHWELVLGTRGRSGEQWDIWEAVYSPVGPDGYPRRIWDKRTGSIDPEVAEHWRENYDLRHILERDWERLGPKLRGKLRIYTGDMDSWHLNNAVYLLEDFLESTTDPPYDGLVEYGDRYEHCWTGDHEAPLSIQRLTVYRRYLPEMATHLVDTAPPGADTTSWRY